MYSVQTTEIESKGDAMTILKLPAPLHYTFT